MSNDKLEPAWRAALEHEQAPLGFAARVEARIREQASDKARRGGWQVYVSRSWLRISAAAVLLVAIVVPLGLRLHQREEAAKGEAARQQVLLALRIAGTQLRTIQHRTRFISTSPLEGEPQ